jgi:hypothetical protein
MSDATANHPAPHAARVHFHASLTLVLAPLAILAGCAWVVLKAFVCWNSRSGETEQRLCEWAFVLPDTVLVCAGLSFAAMLYALVRGGSQTRVHADALRHGYHALTDKHRKRVKGASVTLVFGAALFIGATTWYLVELPPLAALAFAFVLAGTAYAVLHLRFRSQGARQ